MDREGRLYTVTRMGVQVSGRSNGRVKAIRRYPVALVRSHQITRQLRALGFLDARAQTRIYGAW